MSQVDPSRSINADNAEIEENAAENPYLEAAAYMTQLFDPDELEQFENDDENHSSDDASEIDTFFGYTVLERIGSAVQLNPWPEDLLDRRNVYMTAPKSMWGAKQKLKDGTSGWKALRLSVQEFMGSFVNPQIVTQKDGRMFAACELRGNARKAEAVSSIHAMVFDSDVGQTLDDIIPKLQKAGWCYILYTSFSNGKTSGSVPLKNLNAVDEENPTDAELRNYLGKSKAEKGAGYWSHIVDSAEIKETVGEIVERNGKTLDKRRVEFSHSPISKFRVVLPLAEMFIVDENVAKSGKEWEALYKHVADALGIDYDSACKDLTRAFYAGRAPSLDRYQCVVGGETPLVLPQVSDEMLAELGYSNSRKREAARAAIGERKTVDGIPDIETFYWKHGDAFDGIRWLEALDWETRQGGGFSKQAIRCPNEDAHSEPGGTGCVAIDLNASKYDKFVITCRHDHCQGLHTEDFMRMICEEVKETRVDYDLPALEDFLIEFIDDDISPEIGSSEEPAAASAETPKAESAKKPAFAKTRALLRHMPTHKINTFGWIEHWDAKKEEMFPICQAFEVLGQTRTKDGLGWGLLIEFADPDGNLHRDVISEGDLHDFKVLRKRLGDQGLKIAVGSTKFDQLIQRLEPKDRALLVKRPGWINSERFVAPDGSLYGKVGELVVLEKPFITSQRVGSYDLQQEAFDIAIQHGYAHHFLGVLVSAAGALVQFIDLDSSPVISLSGDSSAGKSTAMMLGASGFGNPDIKKEGLLLTLNSTSNGIENPAMRATGTFLGLDETAHMKPADLEKLVFMIAAGRGKTRMKQDASERESKTWLTFGMISSEAALTGLVEKAGDVARVGFSARVADIDVQTGHQIPEAEYTRMVELLKANFGHIGPMFVEYLVEFGLRPEDIRKAINAKVTALVGNGASSLIWRSAGVFGLLWQCGEVLFDMGVIPSIGEDKVRSPFAKETGNSVEAKIKAIWTAYMDSEEAEALNPGQKAVDVLRDSLYALRGNSVHNLFPGFM